MVLKRFQFGIISSLIITLMLSCSSGRKTARDDTPGKESPQYDESFDPLRLNEDEIVFKEEPKATKQEDKLDQIDISRKSEQTQDKLIDGFRIQLFATKDIESATIAKKEAQFVFAEDSLNIYVEFDSPYYKLRIGDFREREEAVMFREVAREKGYSSSWIVKTKVWSNSSPPDQEFQMQN